MVVKGLIVLLLRLVFLAGTSAQTPRALVVVRFVLVGSEEFDGWESLDAILRSQSLVLVSVHCAHLHYALK